MKYIFIFLIILNSFWVNFSLADGDHDEGSSFGENKAILDVHNEGRRFKLSEKAVKALSLKYEGISFLKNDTFQISKTALVSFGEEFGVFVLRDGWYELIEIEVKNKKDGKTDIVSKELGKSDQIVVSGVPLLRVAQLEASGEGGEGH